MNWPRSLSWWWTPKGACLARLSGETAQDHAVRLTMHGVSTGAWVLTKREHAGILTSAVARLVIQHYPDTRAKTGDGQTPADTLLLRDAIVSVVNTLNVRDNEPQGRIRYRCSFIDSAIGIAKNSAVSKDKYQWSPENRLSLPTMIRIDPSPPDFHYLVERNPAHLTLVESDDATTLIQEVYPAVRRVHPWAVPVIVLMGNIEAQITLCRDGSAGPLCPAFAFAAEDKRAATFLTFARKNTRPNQASHYTVIPILANPRLFHELFEHLRFENAHDLLQLAESFPASRQ